MSAAIVQPYDYYLVLDFEATCEADRSKQSPQEIIEFPCVIVDARSLTVVAQFKEYCKPHHKPYLSLFCTKLTGITQEVVDSADDFGNVLRKFREWLTAFGLNPDYVPHETQLPEGAKSFVLVTHGDWDLGEMLPAQLSLESPEVQSLSPACLQRWININSVFESATGIPARSLYGDSGVDALLIYFSIPRMGRLHSGIDDCHNIAAILVRMMGAMVVDFTAPVFDGVCYYCLMPGHQRRTCPYAPVEVCSLCGTPGHYRRDCHMRYADACYNCGWRGHIARYCPMLYTENRHPGGDPICFGCGKPGHMKRVCPEIANNYAPYSSMVP